MDEIVHEFLVESHENLDQLDRDLVALEQEPDSRPLLASVFRTIHTIKGTSGFLAFSTLEKVTHVGEGLLSMLRDGELTLTPEITSVLLELVDAVRALLGTIETTGGEGDADHSGLVAKLTAMQQGTVAVAAEAEAPPLLGEKLVEQGIVRAEDVTLAVLEQQVGDDRRLGEILVEHGAVSSHELQDALDGQVENRRSVVDTTVRVDVELLDHLMRLVGELVLSRNQVAATVAATGDVAAARTWQRLNLITGDLQDGIMKARMQPIESVWNKLPRVVRDLGHAVGKQVRLEMHGADTELDRSVLEAVKDPLTHLVRNAIDHGIEAPDARVQLGKPAEGRLVLRAYHDAGQVVLEITDDGSGIDPARIAATAVDKSLVSADDVRRMSTNELVKLIFLPGFSTAEKVTNVSGRGVGMDVVKTNMERIGGSVDVQSELGKGTTFRITIPLTLAIIAGLIVTAHGQRFAVPQTSMREIVRLDAEDRRTRIESVSGAQLLRLRERLLPLVSLRTAFELGEDGLGENDTVFVCVLGNDDRQFGLVVDRVIDTEEIVVKPLGSVLKRIPGYAGATILGDGRVALILDVWALSEKSGAAMRAVSTDDVAAVGETSSSPVDRRSLLVVRLAGDRRLAIPMDNVARLEEISVRNLERVGDREALQYRDSILPIARLGELVAGERPEDRDSVSVVVYTENGRRVGLVVEEILDIADQHDAVVTDIDGPGVVGTTVVQQQVMEMLDVREAILAADPHFYDETEAETETVAAGMVS